MLSSISAESLKNWSWNGTHMVSYFQKCFASSSGSAAMERMSRIGKSVATDFLNARKLVRAVAQTGRDGTLPTQQPSMPGATSRLHQKVLPLRHVERECQEYCHSSRCNKKGRVKDQEEKERYDRDRRNRYNPVGRRNQWTPSNYLFIYILFNFVYSNQSVNRALSR
ncbi:hypothetical protein BDR26DRAFT_859150 [Obelidium mucronatum]|nr:hypothetical protein BDR26DRAFT_859150 [Obelidium mucronatum]